jgi:hypothetical protein
MNTAIPAHMSLRLRLVISCFFSAFSGMEIQKMRFKKGQSGNPRGKAKGTLHKATRAALELLEGDLETITRKCIDRAKEGDLMAVKLILDKVVPNAKERPISFNFPKLRGAADVPNALSTVLEAVGKGDITPGEGQILTAIMDNYRKGLELADIEARLRALEVRANARS